ncbi:MAG: FAD:protein FMN transferase [Eubacterium ramulus]
MKFQKMPESRTAHTQSGIYKRCVCHGYLYDTDLLMAKMHSKQWKRISPRFSVWTICCLPEKTPVERHRSSANRGGARSPDTHHPVPRALDIYQSTNGAFDISIYPVIKPWGLTTGNFAVPSEVRPGSKTLAGKIILSEENGQTRSRFLPEGTGIRSGGIAKGYTSGRVMDVMESYGIKSAVINLGGNAHVLGNKTDGSQSRHSKSGGLKRISGRRERHRKSDHHFRRL